MERRSLKKIRASTGLLYQLSYEATHWDRSQFIEFISPVRSEMMWIIYEIIDFFYYYYFFTLFYFFIFFQLFHIQFTSCLIKLLIFLIGLLEMWRGRPTFCFRNLKGSHIIFLGSSLASDVVCNAEDFVIWRFTKTRLHCTVKMFRLTCLPCLHSWLFLLILFSDWINVVQDAMPFLFIPVSQ